MRRGFGRRDGEGCREQVGTGWSLDGQADFGFADRQRDGRDGDIGARIGFGEGDFAVADDGGDAGADDGRAGAIIVDIDGQAAVVETDDCFVGVAAGLSRGGRD